MTTPSGSPLVFYYRKVTVRVDDDRFATLGLRQHAVRKSFLDDEPETEPVPDLGKQVSDLLTPVVLAPEQPVDA